MTGFDVFGFGFCLAGALYLADRHTERRRVFASNVRALERAWANARREERIALTAWRQPGVVAQRRIGPRGAELGGGGESLRLHGHVLSHAESLRCSTDRRSDA